MKNDVFTMLVIVFQNTMEYFFKKNDQHLTVHFLLLLWYKVSQMVTLCVGFVVVLFFILLQTLALGNSGLEVPQGLASC